MSGLSAPRILFGVHSISPYSIQTKLPYGILKVVGSADLSLNSSVEELFGGASKFSWAAESKTIASNVKAKVKAYPGFLFTLFLGGTDTTNAAEATGSVSALANWNTGGALVSATVGITSVLTLTSSDNANIMFGKFVIVAVSTTTVDVYAYSDIDFAKGPAAYQNDLLKITASPLTVTSATATPIPNTGISFTGGSGSIALVVGDTAFFSSRPINTGSDDIIIGASTTTIPAFGAVFLSQKRATAEMFEIEAYNVVAAGLPIPLAEMAFSTTELTMSLVYSSAQNAVMAIRACKATS